MKHEEGTDSLKDLEEINEINGKKNEDFLLETVNGLCEKISHWQLREPPKKNDNI